MPRSKHRYFYPIDIDRLARDLASLHIDIAPTRIKWTLLAQCLATHAGEEGRNAFHTMAAVWPDYSRHDSELCYNAALRRHARQVPMAWLAARLRPHGINIYSPRYRAAGQPLQLTKHYTKKIMNTAPPVTIPIQVLASTLRNNRPIAGRCHLTDLLLKLFPQQHVLNTLDRYMMGYRSFTTGMAGDAAIYWQLDTDHRIVNCKEICYKPDGHRDKKSPPMLKYPGNGQCLYGLHLLAGLPGQHDVAIVESEKSAIIMSLVMPDYIWMACGSLSNFTEDMLEPLRHHKIVAFPDVDPVRDRKTGVSVSMAQWEKTAATLRSKGWQITVSDQLEKTVNTSQRLDKIDVADLVINKAMEEFINRLRRHE